MAGLVNQWSSVRKDLEEEEEREKQARGGGQCGLYLVILICVFFARRWCPPLCPPTQREAETYDPEAIERKRKREIEEWKSEQLRTGEAQANVNFLVSLLSFRWEDYFSRCCFPLAFANDSRWLETGGRGLEGPSLSQSRHRQKKQCPPKARQSPSPPSGLTRGRTSTPSLAACPRGGGRCGTRRPETSFTNARRQK